jgi:hypothetical protein
MVLQLQTAGIILGLIIVAPFIIDIVRELVKRWEEKNK